jgi:hypothetical protein
MWKQVLGLLNDQMRNEGTGDPFYNWNPAQIDPEDSSFVWSFMEKKNPLERPTARELLRHKWFTT